MTLREVTMKVFELYEKYLDGCPEYDMDGSAYCPPAPWEIGEIIAFIWSCGYTLHQIENDANALCHEEQEQAMADDGPYGRIV